jgi:predicted metal-dependent hydrolase
MENSKTIQVSGIDIEVEYKKIKNIHLAVYPPDARVHVSAPDYCTDDDLRAFLFSKLIWIRKQQSQVLAQERETRRDYVSGENHYLFGKRYILRIVEEEDVPHIDVDHKYIIMHVRPNATREKRMEVLHEYYRQLLHERLTALFPRWEAKMDIHDFTWTILAMKTQWGSCMQNKREIRMNLALARVPIECIEYIIVHEMAHLKVRLHNKVFEQLLAMYMPSWRKYRQQLNEFVSVPLI